MKMIGLLTAVSLSLMTTTFNVAQARTQSDIQRELEKATTTAVEVYKEAGMTGLIGETQTCYKRLKPSAYYCVYLDLASRHIDQIFIAGTNFPPNAYFNGEQLSSRIGPVFLSAKMDMDTANTYLSTIIPVVNQLVDKKILGR